MADQTSRIAFQQQSQIIKYFWVSSLSFDMVMEVRCLVRHPGASSIYFPCTQSFCDGKPEHRMIYEQLFLVVQNVLDCANRLLIVHTVWCVLFLFIWAIILVVRALTISFLTTQTIIGPGSLWQHTFTWAAGLVAGDAHCCKHAVNASAGVRTCSPMLVFHRIMA